MTFDRGPFHFYAERGRFGIRIGSRGIAVKDARRHRLYYSERNRLRRSWIVGPWHITPLPVRGRKGSA